MKLIVDIPNSLYACANLSKIGDGSMASKKILECVKNGEPKFDEPRDINAICEELNRLEWLNKALSRQIEDNERQIAEWSKELERSMEAMKEGEAE